MGEFFGALVEPDVPFLRYAFIAGVFASVAFGVVGSYVVARRISYIGGAISHCVLGGIGVALYLQKAVGLEWCRPMYGAVASALAAAVVLGLVSMYARQREDTVIGALWATGMAVGLLFITKTPGYIDPMSYLFGNILLITKQDLWMVVGLDVLTVGLGVFFYHKFLAVCFDEEFARLRGVRVGAYTTLLLCLTALTVVLLAQIVGIVMVIALLSLPAAIAARFTWRLAHMMVLATVVSMVCTVGGLAASYKPNLPAGATIILLAGALYLASFAATSLRPKPRPPAARE
jgi:zinc transport system permease protein